MSPEEYLEEEEKAFGPGGVEARDGMKETSCHLISVGKIAVERKQTFL